MNTYGLGGMSDFLFWGNFWLSEIVFTSGEGIKVKRNLIWGVQLNTETPTRSQNDDENENNLQRDWGK